MDPTDGIDLVDLRRDPTSVWMLTNGSAKSSSFTLDTKLLAPLDGNIPPSEAADVTRSFAINQTDVITWVVDGYAYSESEKPIIYGNVSDGWDANTTLRMPFNATIDIIMRIANDSMDTVSSIHPSSSALLQQTLKTSELC